MSRCDDILRRRFVAVATDRFEGFPRLEGVDEEVATLRAWLCDPALADRAFDAGGFEALSRRPSAEDVRRALTGERFTDGDALVLYVTGHGATDKGAHWTVLERSDPARLASTALATLDLLRWLAEHPGLEQVLLVIDLCHAGDLQDEVTSALRREIPESWIALVTAPAGVDAKVGAFTAAVRDAVEALRTGPDRDASALEPHLQSDLFIREVKRRLRENHGQRLVVLQDPYETSCCLPNPKYVPGGGDRVPTGPERRDLAVLAADMAAHWGPRSRGVRSESADEWLFTGREDLMARLVAFVTGPPGTLLVTGRAGSGKSAALARLVTLSDPAFRRAHPGIVATADPLPPEGAVDVAVLATGKSALQIATQVAGALGAGRGAPGESDEAEAGVREVRTEPSHAPDTGTGKGDGGRGELEDVLEALFVALDRRGDGPATVVVDALDEAADPTGTVLTLLRRLNPADAPRLRLLVGLRSAASAGGPGPPPTADGGGPDDGGPPAPPSDGDPMVAPRDLADLTARSLAAEVVAVDGDGWWQEHDLRGYVTRILTRPGAAWAEAPAEAEAVARVIEPASERSFLLASLVANQLALEPAPTDAADPRLQAMLAGGVAETLRADLAASFPGPADRERAVRLLRATALAFGRGLPWRDLWAPVASVLGAGGSGRAPSAGAVGELDAGGGGAPGADDDGGGSRELGDDDVQWLLDHRLGGYLVRDVEDGVTVYRPFHDALRSALAEGPERFVGDGEPPGGEAPPAGTPGARGEAGEGEPGPAAGPVPSQEAAHRAMTRRLLRFLPTGEGDGPPPAYVRRHLVEHAAAGGVLDEEVLSPAALPWLDADTLSRVTRLTEAPRNSMLWVMLSAWRGVRHRWSFDHPEANAAALDVALAAAAGWVPERPARGPLGFHPRWIEWSWGGTVVGSDARALRGVAWAPVAGRPVLAVGASGGVRLWDAATGRPVGEPLALEGFCMAVAMERLDGTTLVAAGTNAWLVRVWDAATGRLVREIDTGDARVRGLALGLAGGRRIVVTGGLDGEVRTWDLARGTEVATMAMEAPVRSLALGRGTAWETPDSAVVVVGCVDGTVSQWDAMRGVPAGPSVDAGAKVNAVATGEVEGRRVLAVGTEAGTARVFDALTGEPVGPPHLHRGEVRGVALGSIGDTTLLATGSLDGTAAVFVPEEGPIDKPLPHPDGVEAVAFAVVDGRDLLVTGCVDGGTRLWDPILPSAARVRVSEQFTTVALSRSSAGFVVAAGAAGGAARAWDAEHGRVLVEGVRTGGTVTELKGLRPSPRLALGPVEGRTVLLSAFGGRSVMVHVADPDATVEIPLAGPGEGPADPLSEEVVPIVDDGRALLALLRGWTAARPRLEVLAAGAGGELRARIDLEGNPTGLMALDWDGAAAGGRDRDAGAPPRRTLVGVLHEEHLEVWDPLEERRLGEVPRPRWSGPVALGSLDGRTVVATWVTEGVRLWDLTSGEPVGPGIGLAGSTWTGLAFGRVGERDVLVTGHYATVRVWNPRTGRRLAALPFATPIEALAVAPGEDDDTLELAVAGPGVLVTRLRVSAAGTDPGAGG